MLIQDGSQHDGLIQEKTHKKIPFNHFTDEEQTAQFKDPVRTAQ